MASLGILPKAQRLLDASAGLAIGWYRIPTRGPQPAANPNNHYVLPQAAIIARVNDAAEAVLPQSSFPPLFWMSRALSGITAPHIWDFGGGYGEAFFRFRRYMPDLRYTVTEIPEIVASARQISSLSPVAFTEGAPESCDLFFSSGVVMPAHECVFTAIKENRPPLVLVSSVEVTDRPTYWSLVVMRRYGRRCPYVTFNRREFVERVEAMGYRLLDSCRQGLSSSGAWLTRHTIGKYPDISLQQARSAAKTLKAEKTLGRLFPRAVPLSSAIEQYLADKDIRPSTRAYTERNLARLKASKVSEVTPTDIIKILDRLSPTSRTQALRVYSAFFNWCIRRHHIDTSPCARMEAGKYTARERVLSDEELKAVWTAAEQVGGHFGSIVQLLVTTGQRRGEIAALQASWVSFENSTITLPASVTKNGREHTLPIGALTAELLRPFTANSGSSTLLFPARGRPSVPLNGWSKSKAALDEISGITGWTLHDLRRTFATRLAGLGVPIHVIEKLLNHTSGSFAGIVSVYQRHQYLDEMRDAMAKWEASLTRLIKKSPA